MALTPCHAPALVPGRPRPGPVAAPVFPACCWKCVASLPLLLLARLRTSSAPHVNCMQWLPVRLIPPALSLASHQGYLSESKMPLDFEAVRLGCFRHDRESRRRVAEGRGVQVLGEGGQGSESRQRTRLWSTPLGRLEQDAVQNSVYNSPHINVSLAFGEPIPFPIRGR